MEHGHSPKPPSIPTQPLFLGLDLSTQQLKVLVLEHRDNITNNDDDDGLRTHSSFAIHLDSELPHYRTQGGVHAHAQQGSGVVTAPVLMWVEALERLFEKMKGAGFPFHRVVSISGAAQQHGSVYWSNGATQAFEALRGPSSESLSSGLVETFKDAFTVEESPIWQDTSTMSQCEEMEVFLGKVEKLRRGRSGAATTTTTVADAAVGEEEAKEVRRLGQQRLAELTGSRAYERYTGSQILKIVQKSPEVYRSTTRISLVSSFLASLLIAGYAAIDVADGSGMNLLDIRTKTWDPALTRFIDQGGRVEESTTAAEVSNSLQDKLGEVDASGTKIQGVLSSWFVNRYGFSSVVKVVTFTGDNPATVMALRAERGDAMVSLGTSDTLLLYTDTHAFISPSDNDNSATASDKGEQDANSSVAKLLSVGYLCHPVDPNGYLMLYCAKNGSLAREQVRDLYADSNWDRFDQYLREGMEESSGGVGFYYFDREIWPPVQGVYRFENGVAVNEFGEQDADADGSAKRAAANVVAICESQFLAMRIRSSQKEDATSSSSLNSPGISRILATGGASSNRVLLQLLANVFGVPVVSMGTDDQQPGAGSAAWGAARKAYLYGRQGDVGGTTRQDADRDSGMRSNSEGSTAILPDLAQTKKYVDRIFEFLRLEASLL